MFKYDRWQEAEFFFYFCGAHQLRDNSPCFRMVCKHSLFSIINETVCAFLLNPFRLHGTYALFDRGFFEICRFMERTIFKE